MRAWLKPPRSLLLILFLLTLVSVSAVGRSGWKLLDQERIVETQHAQECLELAGDQTAARCRIDADPEAIAVALRNLVDNALKYSPNHPTVWVEWGIEGQHVAIRVRDRGAGIAQDERKAIFRKFVRGTAAANVKGSGVGVAMVRHIVAAHGGEITVESEPGAGSTFTMLLPAQSAS